MKATRSSTTKSPGKQWICERGWIHRQENKRRAPEIIQCPRCGRKITLTPNEFHDDAEIEHKGRCRVINPDVTPADESRYG